MNRHRRAVPGLLLRLGVAAAGVIAPSLAARAAARLFRTPARYRPSRRERKGIAEGDAFALRVDGKTLRGWRFGAGPAVLLVHGWGGGAGQLAAFFPTGSIATPWVSSCRILSPSSATCSGVSARGSPGKGNLGASYAASNAPTASYGVQFRLVRRV